ncbi:AAA family ATPase [Sphingomonas sp. PP-CE-1G-424]|uniref:ATP-dependent nuclease n=1 Tax=Sphingomonas sp. PP-CE-1G-424 TaxID=2135658 RepID=UPI0010556F22|nr:AAA family ATPase [Sphingomonas sp. PP-CE-1G-424]TCP65899.1 putative AbiEii toxin of type IV toxin-antitoxin system [Sphingomonas sp. PP-CE-1G-424]
MIDRLVLKFGAGSGEPPLELAPTAITVFVGPNNSGKSKAIAEIAAQCTNGTSNHSDVILDKINFSNEYSDVDEFIKGITLPSPTGEPTDPNYIYVRTRGGGAQNVPLEIVKHALSNPNEADARAYFAEYYMGGQTLVLNGRNRIDLVNDQAGGDLQQRPITSFQTLFRNDDLRKEYSDVVYASLNAHAVIDPTNLGKLRLRLSPTASSPALERGLGNDSVAFHSLALPIERASDGTKAFTGILAEIFAGDPRILLMDEPEAFLHPSLAFNLGREIAQSLAATAKRMFVSTHSPQFLMGCIQSGVPLNVVRLTYKDRVPTARLLPSSDIAKLMRNPLLRSTGVISALFFESVVVTEADPDRAFYQEVNERLLRLGRGIPNCIFLNAQNKQTIPTIISPLRQLGIPAAAIYDVDFVKDGGGVATRFMDAAGIPILAQNGLTSIRAALAIALLRADGGYKINGGIAVLPSDERGAAVDYFDQLDAYGAFVVRGGELESWLKYLGISGHGPSWLIGMFERMGEDPLSVDFISPDDSDVWSFIDSVAAWLRNPDRKGIPV